VTPADAQDVSNQFFARQRADRARGPDDRAARGAVAERGKAVEGGAEGGTVSVLNEQSRRKLPGIIGAPGRVVVYSGSPQLAANTTTARPATDGKAR